MRQVKADEMGDISSSAIKPYQMWPVIMLGLVFLSAPFSNGTG